MEVAPPHLTTLAERQSFRTERRRKRQIEECNALLPKVRDIDAIIQVGLGHWFEGPQLLGRFPSAQFFAIEPVRRYIDGAKQKGFPGEITAGVALERSGDEVSLADRRDRTTVFIDRKDRYTFTVRSYALDDMFGATGFGRIFLWMDCEGAEVRALRGAGTVLTKTAYVLAEVSNRTHSGAAKQEDTVSLLRAHGFVQIAKYRCTALFERRG